MFNDLLKLIKKYNKIVIFKHLRPDGDAVFSSLGLATFIKDNFKNKDVQIFGSNEYDRYPLINIVKADDMKGALAIALDTSNIERLDNETYEACDYVVKIDHHPNSNPYGDLNYVDDKACATCEIIADILFSKTFSKYIISKETCQYLYCGLLTDSMNFTTSNTTAKSLLLASKLVEKGKLDVSGLSGFVYDENLKSFKKITKYREYLKVSKGVGYILANQKVLDEMGFTSDEAKNNIAEFSKISELNIWCVFAYNKKTKLYDGSLRSKKAFVINEIASKYNGGGHKNACGVKNLTLKQVHSLINDLKTISSK